MTAKQAPLEKLSSSKMNHDRVVLFDGVCNMCNSSVQFCLKHDKSKSLKFASLQSEIGQQLQKEYGIETEQLSSVVFIENGTAYQESTAVLHIMKYFGFPWKLMRAFIIVPPFIRNGVYQFIGKNRYKWFGKQETCMLPTPEQAARLL